MRIKTNSLSAGEQARSAEARRSAKPELGKSKWLTSAVGGAVALGAMALCGGSAYAAPVTPPGEEAGLNASSPLPEGVYFVNIFGTGGDYVIDDKRSNLTFDVPVILWATPWQPNFLGFTGRFEVIAAAPVIGNLGLAAYTDHRFRAAPVTWPGFHRACITRFLRLALPGIWAAAGAFPALMAATARLTTSYGERTTYGCTTTAAWLGWSGNLWNSGLKDGSTGPKFTFAAESVYGLTGNNLQTHVQDFARLLERQPERVCDFGQVGTRPYCLRYSTDLENFDYIGSYQARAAQSNVQSASSPVGRSAPWLVTNFRESRCRPSTRSTCMTKIIAT